MTKMSTTAALIVALVCGFLSACAIVVAEDVAAFAAKWEIRQ